MPGVDAVDLKGNMRDKVPAKVPSITMFPYKLQLFLLIVFSPFNGNILLWVCSHTNLYVST